jgi:hypothetical protein
VRVLLVLVSLWGGCAAIAQVASRPLTADESAVAKTRIVAALVKGAAGPVSVEKGQEFAVSGEGFASFWLEPVRYLSHDAGGDGTSYRCGVFVLPAKGAATFVPTLGYKWTEAMSCDGLDGLGFSAAGNGPPRVLLLYSAESPNAAVKDPMVLDWDAAAQRYGGNERLSRRLEDDGKAVSIAGIKRLLKQL